MKKIFLFFALFVCTVAFCFASCQKQDSEQGGNTSSAPRTSLKNTELEGNWQMTTSGGGYVYNGTHYGNSGHGLEVMMKADGTGWWNEIYQLATPGCVQTMNRSMDCTFELKKDGADPYVLIYITAGEYHSTTCTSQTDKKLTAEQVYPKYAPWKCYYKIVSADGDPSQKLLVLSQEEDASVRFKAGQDKKMEVLKKL